MYSLKKTKKPIYNAITNKLRGNAQLIPQRPKWENKDVTTKEYEYWVERWRETYKMGLEGGLWRRDSRRSSLIPRSKRLDRAVSPSACCGLFSILISKFSTNLEASSASLIHASMNRDCTPISLLRSSFPSVSTTTLVFFFSPPNLARTTENNLKSFHTRKQKIVTLFRKIFVIDLILHSFGKCYGATKHHIYRYDTN